MEKTNQSWGVLVGQALGEERRLWVVDFLPNLPGLVVVGLEGCQDLGKVVQNCILWEEEVAQCMCVLLLSRCRCLCGRWSIRLLLNWISEVPSLY